MQEPGVVKVQGKAYFRELTWNQRNLTDYTTKIRSMNMTDNENAWSWSGQSGAFQLGANVVTKLNLNVLTGRVIQQVDEVQLTGNPLAQISYKVSKWAWARRLAAKQMGDSVCKLSSSSASIVIIKRARLVGAQLVQGSS
jgi:hypothetical protein